MEFISNLIIPLTVSFILFYAVLKGVDVFDVFISGAKEGITTSFAILPALIALTTAVGMFNASGALDMLCHLLGPLAGFLGLPTEVIPLALIRPISGSGTLVIFENLLQNFGADSFVGRVASVMLGSTETTFYTIAIYFGAIKMSNVRYTVGASLCADMTGFIMSSLLVRMLLQ